MPVSAASPACRDLLLESFPNGPGVKKGKGNVNSSRDDAIPPVNAVLSINAHTGGYLTMDKTKELIKRGVDNTAAN
ncbi:hypothetical protein F2P81_018948 [Scophthalmus maximus]|uniref:Uncharacterized protein n=1 Tax=Scophthalmus maximus TaxID=52904 RepID=A0A6A4S611_SCOMX|nr:hypothetical protein F2P81_018948 [Scophthalmus maximus]